MQRSTIGQLVLLEEREPIFFDITVNDGVRRNDHSPDVLGIRVIFVAHLEDQLLGKMA